MKSFSQFFIEQNKKDKTVVFAYGRFNPPTTGHEKLINKVISVAKEHDADYFVIPSHSTKPPSKNPLTFQQKFEVLKYIIDGFHIGKFGITFIDVLKYLQQMGYNKVLQIAGSDRQAEFLGLVNKYNGKPDSKTGNIDFNFYTYEVVSSGERDPDSDNLEGMSASKLRNFAMQGDFKNFEKGMSAQIPHKLKLQTFELIRKTP